MRPLLLLVVFALPARAGLYTPHEQFLFDIDEAGYAKPIQFASGFEIFLKEARVMAIPQPGEVQAARADALRRLDNWKLRGTNALTPEELAAVSCDLIRLNRPDEALNLLQPLTRDPRTRGYIPSTHLAMAHAARGEWREAAEQQKAAFYEEFPTKFAKLTKQQLAWLKRVERDYHLPYLQSRAEESRGPRVRDLREEPDPIFTFGVPPKKSTPPIRWIGPSGEYTAGSMDATERAKLPPDALAIVQQLVLWHPRDPRLYWLLGELLNLEGDVETAYTVIDYCSFVMQYSNPILIGHRQVLLESAATAAKQRADEAAKAKAIADAEEQRLADEKRDYEKRFWWILACGVGLGVLIVYYQLREVFRRLRKR